MFLDSKMACEKCGKPGIRLIVDENEVVYGWRCPNCGALSSLPKWRRPGPETRQEQEQPASYDDDYDDSGHDYSSEDDWMGADSDYDQGGPENLP